MSGYTFSDKHSVKLKNLYEVLGIEKTATDDDIKRAYRKLALRYHPDKNLDGDPLKTEKFKEINYAHSILSNPQKKKIYENYGEIGLKMADRFGEKRTKAFLLCIDRPWILWILFIPLTILTCGWFGCFCCCNFCCGRCKKNLNENNYYYCPRENSKEYISVQVNSSKCTTQQKANEPTSLNEENKSSTS